MDKTKLDDEAYRILGTPRAGGQGDGDGARRLDGGRGRRWDWLITRAGRGLRIPIS